MLLYTFDSIMLEPEMTQVNHATPRQIENLLSNCQDNGYSFHYFSNDRRYGACLYVRNSDSLHNNYMVCGTSRAWWLRAWVGTGAENIKARGIKPCLSPIVLSMLRQRKREGLKHTYSFLSGV